jgi:hypothetical protein
MAEERYLGDGLFASLDGGMIKLRAPREDRDDVMYLEVETWRALQHYVANVWKFPAA